VKQAFDWEEVERSPAFRSLVASRRRFILSAGTTMMGLALLYIILAGVAPDVLGVKLAGSLALGWVAGCALLVATWIVCLAYVRRSDREWEPLSDRIVAAAGDERPAARDKRFERPGARGARGERVR
jgi:uncharacterized membrane protein (DUF485 family)